MLTSTSPLEPVFKAVMRSLASTVVVITSSDGESRNGLTATAMCSVSADPPSILVCVNRSASANELIERSGCFAVNVLSNSQLDIAQLFSTSKLSPEARFGSGVWSSLETGAPILLDAVANIDCLVADRMTFGTHTIYVGQMISALQRQGEVILYQEGAYRSVMSLAA